MITTEKANELLPQKPTEAATDPTRLKYLMIGPPKWGKTTFFLDNPNVVLLATEEGHAFHKAYKLIIDDWHQADWGEDNDGNTHTSMTKACEAVAASDRFDFAVIDTADMAAKLCLDHHYKVYGVKHAADAGDFGKGWDICLTQPFRQAIIKLLKAGIGVAFITHTNLITKKVGGQEISRWETTLPSQVQKFLHTQADLILHGSFGRRPAGAIERDRVISMDGSNEILAGSRVRGDIHLPKKYVVDHEHPWQQWKSFFEDEDASITAEKDYETRSKSSVRPTVEAEPAANTLSEHGPDSPEAKPDGAKKPVKKTAARRAIA